MADELPLSELRQVLRRGAETYRVFAQAEAVIIGVERATREAEVLGARIEGLRREAEVADAQVVATRTDLERLTREATALRSQTEHEYAERVAQLGLEYGEREAREKALYAERLGAMNQSYDEAHAARRTETERLIAEADEAVAAAFEHRDLTVRELEREQAEARDRLAHVQTEVAGAEGELAEIRDNLRRLAERAGRSAAPPA